MALPPAMRTHPDPKSADSGPSIEQEPPALADGGGQWPALAMARARRPLASARGSPSPSAAPRRHLRHAPRRRPRHDGVANRQPHSGQADRALGHTHVPGPVTYSVAPPVGGDHNAVWTICGAYDRSVPNERSVHDLEHGAVWITYRLSLPTTRDRRAAPHRDSP